ncbi:MAG: biosynthesis cluster domain-containing protein [Actinobacteria bacterium]|nr:biosynthesis cluster domain-containing protein [Actinomycetota bacterium]
MCGHNSLLVGQIGDWTWAAVSALCGTDVLAARDRRGAATYLSFYYYRIRGSRRFHLRTPTFGDWLTVTSGLFDFGSESVLALHRISPAEPAEPGTAGLAAGPRRPTAIDPVRFYAGSDDGCLYVENFNRWVARSREDSNEELLRASPADFTHRHLPELPQRYSPRPVCQRARTELTFLDPDGAGLVAREELRLRYEVDPSRDLNGVGLLYFASYFAIVDWALLRLWRRLGRDDRSFLDRVVADQQLCYLGNADLGSVVTVVLRRWQPVAGGDRELVDLVLRDSQRDRLLAVCTLELLTGGAA